ncbi:hypothetical protein HDE_05019 [Halotydeus destructor]|nr:hypothetical protein HDE_05019 [Halotydeus destructor]
MVKIRPRPLCHQATPVPPASTLATTTTPKATTLPQRVKTTAPVPSSATTLATEKTTVKPGSTAVTAKPVTPAGQVPSSRPGPPPGVPERQSEGSATTRRPNRRRIVISIIQNGKRTNITIY